MTTNDYKLEVCMAEDTCTLKVQGCIGWDTNAIEFCDAVREAVEAGAKKLVIRINSLGGYCHDGYAMGMALKNCGVPTHAEVYGHAESMAGFLVQCCDTRTAHHGSTYMVHQPRAGMVGTVDELLDEAQHLCKMRDDMFDVMAARTTAWSSGKEMSDAHQQMKNYTAEEALDLGLLDEVIGAKQDGQQDEPKPAEPGKTDEKTGEKQGEHTPGEGPATSEAQRLQVVACSPTAMMRLTMCGEDGGESAEPAADDKPSAEATDAAAPAPAITREEVQQMVADGVAAALAAHKADDAPAEAPAPTMTSEEVQQQIAAAVTEQMAALGVDPQQLPGTSDTNTRRAAARSYSAEQLAMMDPLTRLDLINR